MWELSINCRKKSDVGRNIVVTGQYEHLLTEVLWWALGGKLVSHMYFHGYVGMPGYIP